MVFIMSLHEFDSVRLLLAKGDSDSLKSLWPKYRILDAARISGVLRGCLNFKNARFRRFYSARFTWSPSAPTNGQQVARMSAAICGDRCRKPFQLACAKSAPLRDRRYRN